MGTRLTRVAPARSDYRTRTLKPMEEGQKIEVTYRAGRRGFPTGTTIRFS
jgi:hypothetical protein